MAHPYLELHILDQAGGERWVPFSRDRVELQGLFSGSEGWTATVEGEKVVFSSEPSSRPAYRQQEPVQGARLQAGESLDIEGSRIWVIDARRPSLATLELHEGDVATRSWNLKPQAYRIGRRGSTRNNHIEINHPTISRAQASLFPADLGRFTLLAESPTSRVSVNGKKLEVQEICQLHHGDLIQLGDLNLRFHQTGQNALAQKKLTIHSMGRFEVQWGEQRLVESQWKVDKARWLLARLAWSWGQPVSTDEMMELLWPEFPALRGRKNLSQCLTALKQALDLEDEELIIRTPAILQLNPAHLAEHDAPLVKALAASSEPAGWEQALALYEGPYLPSAFDEYFLLLREELHASVLSAAERLAQYRYQKQDYEGCVQAAQKGLQLDPCHQQLARWMMEASLSLGRYEQGLKCFENLRKQLWQQLEVEPSTDLLRLQQRMKLQMP